MKRRSPLILTIFFRKRNLYSGLCVSYALNHPLLQVQLPAERSKLSKRRQNKEINSCTKLSLLLEDSHPCLAKISVDAVSNIRLGLSFSFLKDGPKACPICGPKNNLQVRINSLFVKNYIISAQLNRPNNCTCSHTNLGWQFRVYLSLPRPKKMFCVSGWS